MGIVQAFKTELLNIKFGVAGQLTLVKGSGGFQFILIRNRSATALISRVCSLGAFIPAC